MNTQDFFTLLSERAGIEKSLIQRALTFCENADTDTLSRLFFESEKCEIKSSGILCFDEAFYPYEFYEEMKKYPLPIERVALYVYIFLAKRSFDEHIARSLDEGIFFDTLKSLGSAVKIYENETGEDGIYDYRFLANHVRTTIVRLGVFEYQYGHYRGERAVFMHVPNGADLSQKSRTESYKMAREYFGDYQIVLDSWLLFPPHRRMLGKNSKIVGLMDDFKIQSVLEIKDYRELFHIFGRTGTENNVQTTLTRAYKDRMAMGLSVGSAVGILIR